MKKRLLSFILCCVIVLSLVVIPSNKSFAASGYWHFTPRGWWYEYSDGSYAKSEYIDGCWLNGDGWYDSDWDACWKSNRFGWWYESTGWYPTNQWLKIDGYWYYFKSSGYIAVNEWIGSYYFGNDGRMMRNSWIDGYYVGNDGAWIPNYKLGDNSSQSQDQNGIKVTNVSLDKNNITVGTGEKIKLKASVSPKDAMDKSLIWTSSDESVASVDSDGNVVAKRVGGATIKVSSKSGAYAICLVNVLNIQIELPGVPLTLSEICKGDIRTSLSINSVKISTIKYVEGSNKLKGGSFYVSVDVNAELIYAGSKSVVDIYNSSIKYILYDSDNNIVKDGYLSYWSMMLGDEKNAYITFYNLYPGNYRLVLLDDAYGDD